MAASKARPAAKADPMAAFAASLTPEQKAAFVTALVGEPEAEEAAAPAPKAKAGVKAVARKADVNSREDKPASLRQKRTLVDYTAEAVLAKRIPKPRRDKIVAAAKAYEAALNAYLLAVGVTGPANLNMADAFDMIAASKADRSA